MIFSAPDSVRGIELGKVKIMLYSVYRRALLSEGNF